MAGLKEPLQRAGVESLVLAHVQRSVAKYDLGVCHGLRKTVGSSPLEGLSVHHLDCLELSSVSSPCHNEVGGCGQCGGTNTMSGHGWIELLPLHP